MINLDALASLIYIKHLRVFKSGSYVIDPVVPLMTPYLIYNQFWAYELCERESTYLIVRNEKINLNNYEHKQ